MNQSRRWIKINYAIPCPQARDILVITLHHYALLIIEHLVPDDVTIIEFGRSGRFGGRRKRLCEAR